MNEEIEKLKQTNDKLYFALCAMVDANGGVAVMPTPGAKQQNRALNQARGAIADARGEGYAEYCCKCKVMLPAYTHDAICQRCDMMAEIYKQDEIIEELTAALKGLVALDDLFNDPEYCEHHTHEGAYLAYYKGEYSKWKDARAAIAKAERRDG